jgi:hypothetical protein
MEVRFVAERRDVGNIKRHGSRKYIGGNLMERVVFSQMDLILSAKI